MRLRNIPNADNIIKESKYVIENPKKYKGKMKELFENENDIYIEIGMGKGNFIINNAKKYPNINFIGIEKYASVLVKACEKLKEEELPNLKIFKYDANEINELFDKEIDLLYLNFSDPWPKERHKKRRLTSPEFLNKYKNIFKNQNHIIFKTDNRKLFEYSIKTFNEENFKIENISLNLYQDNDINNIPTEYETKFHEQGYPIYKIEVKK